MRVCFILIFNVLKKIKYEGKKKYCFVLYSNVQFLSSKSLNPSQHILENTLQFEKKRGVEKKKELLTKKGEIVLKGKNIYERDKYK